MTSPSHTPPDTNTPSTVSSPPHPIPPLNVSPITPLLPSTVPNRVAITLENVTVTALVDTGASLTCMSKEFYDTSGLHESCPLTPPQTASITGVTNTLLQVHGDTSIPVRIGDIQTTHTFCVIDIISTDVILGVDFLTAHNAHIDFADNTLTFAVSSPPPSLQTTPPTVSFSPVYALQSVRLPPNSRTLFNVAVDHSSPPTTGTFIPDHTHPTLTFPHCLFSVSDCHSVCEVINTADDYVVLHAGDTIGFFTTSLEDFTCVPFDDPTASVDTISSPVSPHTTPPAHTPTRSQHIQAATNLGIKVGDVDITCDQRDDLLALIGEHSDCFATSIADLGKTKFHDFHIDTGDSPPLRKRAYRYSPPVMQQISEQVQQMLEHDIIEPSTSEWLSPVVMVKKKGTNKLRFCVDFRHLNKVTRPLSFAMPRLDDVIDALSGSKIYSVTDMRQGFWQLGVHEDSRDKTSFTCHEGVFRFKRLPFELHNSPAHYQTKVSQILGKMAYKHAICYIDDRKSFTLGPFSPRLHFLQTDLTILRDAAKANILSAQDSSKRHYDKNTKPPTFCIGDKVWIKVAQVPRGISAKLINKFDGPFYISSICPNGFTYRLRRCSNDKLLRAPVHSNRLRQYRCPKLRQTNPLKPPQTDTSTSSDTPKHSLTSAPDSLTGHSILDTVPPTSTTNDADTQVYIVDRLLACKTVQGKRHYKVKWRGYRTITWEPASHIPGQLRRIFHATRTNTGRARRRLARN